MYSKAVNPIIPLVMFIEPNVDNIIIMYHNYNRHCKLFNKLILRLSGWCFHIY